jgi:hypothetical protein
VFSPVVYSSAAEPPSTSAVDDAASSEKVERMLGLVHPSRTAHVALLGHHILPLLLALLRRGFAAVYGVRPGSPSSDGETADVVWIADMRSEGELDDALRIARARTSEKTRVVVEAATLVGCDGLAAIRDHATRFGFCVLRTDRAARRTVLAAVPRQAMAA